jgi:stage II sporulation protein GA (sporulation sigma-E factor processing peptidase)
VPQPEVNIMPEQPELYVDVLFLINFVMDCGVLWAAARVSRVRFASWRLASAACVGAIYSILVLLPQLYFLSAIWIKFLVSLLMLGVAFLPLSWKKFGQVLLCFYLIAFLMGGAVLGFVYFMNNFAIQPVFSNVPLPYLWLAIALGTAVLLGRWGVAFLRKIFIQDLLKVPVLIKMQGQEIRVDGLVDTGNQLVDPITGAPVVIVEYDVLAPYLPPNARSFFPAGGETDLEKVAQCFAEAGYNLPIRVIPFTTIGKRHGMLVGFKPDEITILTGDQKVRNSNVVVGIYSRRLSPRGTYHALLHPDLLHASA